MRLSIIILIILANLLLCSGLIAAHDSIREETERKVNRKLTAVVASEAAIGVGCLVGLYSLWYADYPSSSFHFINDNNEWRGMDKAGHSMSAYYLGKVGYESLVWGGMKKNKAVWYGGLVGLAYLGTVEVFDGFSAEWGASPGDLVANTAGSALFIGQQLLWKEQRFLLKWSFQMTEYAQYNPDQMGKGFAQRMLKDYNGQTYWLSANIASLTGLEGRFPSWLNLAAGYGADGMTGPRSNPLEKEGVILPSFERRSQFYLAPDIDLTRIPTRNKTLRLILDCLGFLKFPLPTLEFNHKGLKFHPIYF